MKVNTIKCIKLIIVALLVVGCSDSMEVTNVNEPDILVIPLENCQSKVVYSGNDNCNKNQCEDKNNCVCLTKNQSVTWLIGGKPEFKLQFPNGSPFDNNCGETFEKKKQKCKVKNKEFTENQPFDYNVILQNCTEGTDPRIIIRTTT